MKKTVLVLGCVSALSIGQSWAQSFLTENFNGVTAPALPASWESSVADAWKTGNPDVVASRIGTALGGKIASIGYTAVVGIDGGKTTADGAILSTPALNIPSGATTAGVFFNLSYLKYKDARNRQESLFVVASIDGGQTWEEVGEVKPNEYYLWERRTANIGAYAGKNNVKIGLRYNNSAAALLGVALDNFEIMDGTDILFSSTQAGDAFLDDKCYAVSGASTSIKGVVVNNGSKTITGYTVKYQQGSNAPVSYNVTTSISPLASEEFTHATPFSVANNADYPFKVWVEVASDINHGNDSLDLSLVGIPFMPEKKLVFEEGTGAWCVWCPRGTVAMDAFAESNPGKATQIAVHNNGGGADAMVHSAYAGYINRYVTGYPSIVVDRTTKDDPGNTAALYNSLKENFGFADVTLNPVSIEGSTITAKVNIKAAVEIKNAKLALVTTESNLSGEGNGWNQANAYSGGGNGVMGGWEKFPRSVAGTKFHFVARDISPAAAGAASGLPATMAAGSSNEATLTATLDSTWNRENLQYIVLLLGEDGTVLNSNFTELPHLEAVLPSGTSVANIEAGINEAVLYPNPAKNETYLAINAQEATIATISVTDVMGRSVRMPSSSKLQVGKNTIKVPTQLLASGTYLVNLTTEKGNVTLKLQVVR